MTDMMFVKRGCRWNPPACISLWHMARHLPHFIAARRHFEPAKISE